MTALYGRLPPALDEVLRQRLQALGWSLFGFGSSIGRTWTFPVSGDLVATLAVYGPWHFHTPAAFTVDVGVGHPPSTRLMPRLTQRPSASLYAVEDLPWRTWEAEDPDDPETQTSFAEAVIELAGFAVDAAGRLVLSGLLERQLRELARDDDHDPTTLPLYLAATGRVDEALETIEESVGREGAWRNWSEEQDRRMARQLRLWADAGAPMPPELDEWPPNAFDTGLIEVGEGSNWSRARARSRAVREAQAAVRRTLRETPEDSSDTPAAQRVAHILRREYGQRDVQLSPGRALQQAELLLLEREPLGRWRVGMTVLAQLPGVLRQLSDTAREIRGNFTEKGLSDDETPAADPELEAPWPEGALFDVPPDSDSWVEVALDATTDDALRETATLPDGSTREFIRLRAWIAEVDTLKRDAARKVDPSLPHGSFLVGTGHFVLGHFPPGSDGHTAFGDSLTAAAAFREIPVAEGELRWTSAPSGRSLALHPPQSTWLPPADMR